jgi:endonuclease YncB( thermonuclease family)
MPHGNLIGVILLASALTFTLPAHADITGRASVIDGDTLRVDGQRIRLSGVDAPELDQVCQGSGKNWCCGRQASLALHDKIEVRPVSCEPRDIDRYHRVVAVCSVGGEDLGAWLVAHGWALAYRRYSTDYVQEENGAAASKLGMWRGDFVAPWDWRHGERLTRDRC